MADHSDGTAAALLRLARLHGQVTYRHGMRSAGATSLVPALSLAPLHIPRPRLRSSPSLKGNGWKRPYIRESATAELLRNAIAHAPAMDADRRRFLDVIEEELPGAGI